MSENREARDTQDFALSIARLKPRIDKLKENPEYANLPQEIRDNLENTYRQLTDPENSTLMEVGGTPEFVESIKDFEDMLSEYEQKLS